jgi:hypothetical protein
VRWIRAYSRYFNDRYQTYGRHVHYWVYWANTASGSTRRADAADNYARLRPFAALDNTEGAYSESYLDAMAGDHGVFMFQGSPFSGTTADFFRKYAPRVWSFVPDVEHWAAGFVSYVCTKVAPYPVAHAQGGIGNDGRPFNGRSRKYGKYGFLSPADPARPGHSQFAQLAKDGLAQCGVRPVVEGRFTSANPNSYYDGSGDNAGVENAAALKQADVTTVVYLGAADEYTGNAADGIKYYPEVLVAADGSADRLVGARLQNQNWWRNAWVMSHQLRVDRMEEDPGTAACLEGDHSLTVRACDFAAIHYRDHFMLFKAIQAAGPRLTPQTVDRGMHAIPAQSSTNPYVASCYFDPADFSCVKDFIEAWWDETGRVPGIASPGCYRLPHLGQRFLAGDWPPGDDVFVNASDPCTAYSRGGQQWDP